METTITQVSPVEFELEIRAPKEVLEPKIDQAVRERRHHVTLKGFRPGRVPLSLVRKLHGRAISYEVVDNLIQETYKGEVLE
ncbi:MAG: trigger factor family protein, partial [Rhodothermales bacterium]